VGYDGLGWLLSTAIYGGARTTGPPSVLPSILSSASYPFRFLELSTLCERILYHLVLLKLGYCMTHYLLLSSPQRIALPSIIGHTKIHRWQRQPYDEAGGYLVFRCEDSASTAELYDALFKGRDANFPRDDWQPWNDFGPDITHPLPVQPALPPFSSSNATVAE